MAGAEAATAVRTSQPATEGATALRDADARYRAATARRLSKPAPPTTRPARTGLVARDVEGSHPGLRSLMFDRDGFTQDG